MNTPTQPAEQYPPAGSRPLNNQEAKVIADRIMRELWAEFHPMATLKVLTNLKRIFDREQKTELVRLQAQRTGMPPPLKHQKFSRPGAGAVR